MPPKKRKIDENTIGYRVHQARKKMNMTAKELADKVRMKVTYIVDIERDEITDVPVDVLFRIANALGTTIADLRGNLPVRKAPEGTKPGDVVHYRKAK